MRRKRMRKINKLQKRARKLAVFTSMTSCCIFAGAYLIHPTEAVFTSSVTETGTIHAAFVFPATTKKLLEEVQQTYKQIHTAIPTNIDIKNIKEGDNLKKQLEETDKYFSKMKENHKKLKDYFDKMQSLSGDDKRAYDFLKKDYHAVKSLYDKLSELEKRKENAQKTIDKQIENLKKQSSLENANKQNVDPSSEQEKTQISSTQSQTTPSSATKERPKITEPKQEESKQEEPKQEEPKHKESEITTPQQENTGKEIVDEANTAQNEEEPLEDNGKTTESNDTTTSPQSESIEDNSNSEQTEAITNEKE